MNRRELVEFLIQRLPELLAVYLFGSRARGDARPDSDLDLAVLVAGKLILNIQRACEAALGTATADHHRHHRKTFG